MGRVLIEDTRQQAGKHDIKHEWFAEHGVPLVRSKLPFGDYAVLPPVAVDTKATIAELAYDIDQDHKRFRSELIGARDAGVRLVVLVENADGVATLADLADWRECATDFARRIHARRRIEGARLAKACATMAERYGAEFLFCAPEASASLIHSMLLGGGAL